MIKFFRKIRKSLLVENRFTKYLLYAIGEIVLVVIGILIALYINNNNEQKKKDRDANKLLIQIQDETFPWEVSNVSMFNCLWFFDVLTKHLACTWPKFASFLLKENKQ